MSNAQEAVKTRHKETSLIFPVLALVVLFLWGSSQTLPVVIAINLLALIGILNSAFSVVRHADVLAHRLGEPYGSLILSLSVVILEQSCHYRSCGYNSCQLRPLKERIRPPISSAFPKQTSLLLLMEEVKRM